ncbi:UNVERIFIED_CONTAM: hypothetical protein GTU68_015435 [Idotea baltica]|nr:hypothetical protein [Idotea baltica]
MSSLLQITRELSEAVSSLSFSEPVSFIYNPLSYAEKPIKLYLEQYATRGAKVLLLGMNPGPFGMAQSGIPFGDTVFVKDWMNISAPVGKPPKEHPKRPVDGFDCARREVSGSRLWGWAKERYEQPEEFFNKFFVWNYCPLVFMGESGKNITPDKLPKEESAPLFQACDLALREIVSTLKIERLVGIGKFAEKQAGKTFADSALEISSILHPSPASPLANRGWAEAAEKGFLESGIEL